MNSNIINVSRTLFDADAITAKPFTAETSIQILRGTVEAAENENKVEPYSIVELTAKYASFRDRGKTINIIASSAAVISIISSVTLLWMIRRSHIGLSSTYHRLLLGLCIGDIIFSSSVSCLTIWAPSELNYLVWKAMGNATTCTIQGLVFSYGFLVGAFYNCSLNLYYLALVKYEKTDEYIRKKIEPFLHGTSILIPLPVLITCLYNNNFNDHGGGACIKPVYNPPHCIGYEDGEVRDGFTIACGRGRGLLFYYILFILTSACPPLIIGGSLFSIYRSVLKLEKKLSKYGVRSLRSNLNLSYLSNAEESTHQMPNHEVNANSSTRNTSEKSLCSLLRRCGRGPFEKCLLLKICKPNTAQFKSQAVMHRAIAYSISYFLTWSVMSIFFFQEFVAKKDVSVPIRGLGAIFIPLQGFYNLVIFIYPTVFAIMNKSKREKVSLRQAIVKAFWSRGTDTNICSTSRAGARRQSAESSNDRRRCSDKLMSASNNNNTQKDRQSMFVAGIKNETAEKENELIQHGMLDNKSAMYVQNTINNSNVPMDESHGFLEALNDEDAELVAVNDSISTIKLKDSIAASIIGNKVLNDDASNADTTIGGDKEIMQTMPSDEDELSQI